MDSNERKSKIIKIMIENALDEQMRLRGFDESAIEFTKLLAAIGENK